MAKDGGQKFWHMDGKVLAIDILEIGMLCFKY